MLERFGTMQVADVVVFPRLSVSSVMASRSSAMRRSTSALSLAPVLTLVRIKETVPT